MTNRVYSLRRGTPLTEAVYVGRPSKWGNPFKVGEYSQEEAVTAYRLWINQPEQAELRNAVQTELRGKDLVCWCTPKPCHADVLLEIANE